MTRITPDDELYQMIVSGQAPTIIDARSKSALDALPFVIQGARHLTPEETEGQRSATVEK